MDDAVVAGIGVGCGCVGIVLGVCLTLLLTRRGQSSAIIQPEKTEQGSEKHDSRRWSSRRAGADSQKPSAAVSRRIIKAVTKAKGLFGRYWRDRVGGSVEETASAQDAIVETICHVARQLTQAEFAVFFAVEDSGRMLALYKTKEDLDEKRRSPNELFGSGSGTSRNSRNSDIEEPRLAKLSLAPEQAGFPYEVVKTGVPADARHAADLDEKMGLETTSLLCVPVYSKAGAILGVMQVCNREKGAEFSDADELALHDVSRLCSIALTVGSSLVSAAVDTREQSHAMDEVATALADKLELSELTLTIRDTARRLMHAERCTVFLVNRQTQQLEFHTDESEGKKRITIPIDAGLAGHVARHGGEEGQGTLNIADAYSDARFNRKVDEATGFRTQAVLVQAIVDKHRDVIGVIQVINKVENRDSGESDKGGSARTAGGRPGKFSASDEKLLQAMTTHLSLALSNARLFEDRESLFEGRLKESTALFNIAQALSQDMDMAVMMQRVRAETMALLQAERCTLFMVDIEAGSLWFHTDEKDGAEKIEMPITQGIAGEVALTGNTINIANVYEDARFDQTMDRKTGFRTKSMLCMPIVNRSQSVIGVAQLLNKVGAPRFTKADEQVFSSVSAHLGISLINAELYSDMVRTKRYYESILSSSGDLILTLDNEGKLASWNQSPEPMFGELDELTENHFSDWVEPACKQLADALTTAQGHRRQVGTSVPLRLPPLPDEEALPGADATPSGAHRYLTINFKVCALLERKTPDKLRQSILGEAPTRDALARRRSSVEDQKVQEALLRASRTSRSTAGELENFRPMRRKSSLVSFGVAEKLEALRLSADGHASPTLDAPSPTHSFGGGHEQSSAEGYQRIGTLLVIEDTTLVSTMRAAHVMRCRSIDRLEQRLELAHTELQKLRAPTTAHTESQTPLSRALGHLQGLINVKDIASSMSNDALLETLVECRNWLQSEHLFTPRLDEQADLDDHTRGFLLQEYTSGRKSTPHQSFTLEKSFKRAAGRYFSSEADIQRQIAAGHAGEDRLDMFSFGLNTLKMSGLSSTDGTALTPLLVADVFDILGMAKKYSIPRDKLTHFVLAVRDGYKDNPYHNWQHACHVLHNVFLLAVYTPLYDILTDLDLLALVIAAYCHDVGHGGITNSFLVNTADPLALVYNDASVWENHHAATTFRILNAPANNILVGLQPAEYKELRASIISAILATDMAVHYEVLSRVQNKNKSAAASDRSSNIAGANAAAGSADAAVPEGAPTSPLIAAGWVPNSRDDRMLLQKVVLHTCDIGHFASTWDTHVDWSQRVRLEFNAQCASEREKGIPVSSFLEVPNDTAMAKSQVGFANFIVLPIWDTLAVSLPMLQPVCSLIRLNVARWDRQHRHLSGGAALSELSYEEEDAAQLQIMQGLRALRPLGLLAGLEAMLAEEKPVSWGEGGSPPLRTKGEAPAGGVLAAASKP